MSNKQMVFSYLSMRRNGYSGEISGHLDVLTPSEHEIKLQLNHAQCQRIMAVVADSLVEVAQQAAEMLKSEVLVGVMTPKGDIALIEKEEAND